MRVYYATVFDSKNVHFWSGLGYYIGKMLENQGLTVEYLNNFPIKNKVVHKLKKRLLREIFNEGYSLNFTENVSMQYAKMIEATVPKGSLIFSPNTVILANLDNSYKKVLFTDATFERLRNFYPAYTNIRPEFLREAQQIERKALQQSDMLIYSSQWAADSAVDFYNVNPAKIAVVPFGPNIDFKLSERGVVSVIENRLTRKKVRLLLAGVSWFRKGGDYAIEVLERLNQSGIEAELHLVGFKKLPSVASKRNIIDHGFISKSSDAGQRQFAKLLAETDFLLLPSRADCTPVVVAEANSYGLPCLISDVGGNHSIVENDVNGFIFDFTKGPAACCNYIISLKDSPEEYTKLCKGSYNKYRTMLNWEVSGRKIAQLLQEINTKTNAFSGC